MARIEFDKSKYALSTREVTVILVKTIDLSFDGYWREVNQASIPNNSGVYLVYACRYDQASRTVTLEKLIYIGEAGDVRDRTSKHEKWPEWRKLVPQTSQICFSFAEITSPDRERAEAALIYYHKPPCNDEYLNEFPFEDTEIKSTGRCALITSPITAKQTT